MINLKKLVTLSLALTLITTTLLTPTLANSADISSSNIPVEKNLKTAKLLGKSEVLTIVKSHIENYMKNDIQTKGKSITPGTDLINLYDLNDNLFAYVVPLLENGKEEIGYITVGALEDGYNVYEIFIDPDALQNLKSELITAENSPAKKIIFVPPFSYILKDKVNDEDKFYDLSQHNRGKDITDQVKENKTKIEKVHNTIRSTKNKDQIQKILLNTTKSTVANTTTQSVSSITGTTEDVRLINEASFIPITNGTQTYYGGDQNWYSTSSKQNNGCGPTAAANITSYLDRKSSASYGNLYSPSGITKSEFLTHMDALYTALDPSFIGEFTLTGFRNDVKTFASGRGVTLTDSYNDCSGTIDGVANFIKYGLIDDTPVACLNRELPGWYDYAWHWMSITKYFKDVNDNRWIAVSTWGERRSIDFSYYYNSTLASGGGFVYFN